MGLELGLPSNIIEDEAKTARTPKVEAVEVTCDALKGGLDRVWKHDVAQRVPVPTFRNDQIAAGLNIEERVE